MARYCAVCYFQLPRGSDPIENTDIGFTTRAYGVNIPPPPPPCDLSRPLSKEDLKSAESNLSLSEVPVKWIFRFDSLEKSARRGCKACAKIHGIISILSPGIFDAGAEPEEGPKFSWRLDYGTLLFALAKERTPVFNHYYKLFFRDTNYASRLPSVEYLYPTIAGDPSGDTSSNVSLERIKLWLANCISEHSSCGGDEENNRPHRIFSVGDEGEMKLLEEVAKKAKYACLSYRWGTASLPLRLVASNLGQFKKKIPEHMLPLLFREARDVILGLGIRHLWIDSLCILQDDLEDWRVEAASMASIYKNAYVTIAAAISVSCNDSLFRKAKSTSTSQGSEIITLQDRPVYLAENLSHPWGLGSQRPWSNQWKSFPLLSRGWVYQERMLSRRVIYFAEHEVLWECVESKSCECRYGESIYGKHLKLNPADISWKEVVDVFTSMKLTEPKDRLPAIAGIARQYAFPYRGEYLSGIWEKEFDDSVLWSRNDHCYDESLRRILLRPRPQVALSWSWASVQSAVAFFFGSNQLIKLLGWSMKGKGPDEYGEMQTASLVVSGPVVPGTIYYGTDALEVRRGAPIHPAHLQRRRERGRLSNDQETIEADKGSSFNPPKPSNASKDTELRDIDFNVVVGKHTLHWNPDYAIQRSGQGYVESGTDVLLLFAREVVFIVLRCVDRELGYYERIGCAFESIVIECWLEQAFLMELVLL